VGLIRVPLCGRRSQALSDADAHHGAKTATVELAEALLDDTSELYISGIAIELAPQDSLG